MSDGSQKNALRVAVCIVAACILVGSGIGIVPGWAQTGTAELTGTVRDQNGGVVPGAAVTLTQTQTGLVRKAQTVSTGSYYFGDLPRGPYRLVVEKQGFKQWEGNLLLVVGQNATADATLTVGQVTQVVEVQSAETPINVQNGQISTVISYTAIQNLPVNGRQISNLFGITPGVESGTAPRT
ncbi:MAG: carboxypeptidase-like regulatory domain-containing protein, partial [Terriglobia bacterium]